MFDIGWPELLVVAIVLIIVVGPKDLPAMLRAFGRTTTKLRKMAGEFRGQFDEALREADLDGVRKTINEARSLNPMNQIRDAVNPLKQAGDDIKANLKKSVLRDTPADKTGLNDKSDDKSANDVSGKSTKSDKPFEVPDPGLKLASEAPKIDAPARTQAADATPVAALSAKSAAKTSIKSGAKAGPKTSPKIGPKTGSKATGKTAVAKPLAASKAPVAIVKTKTKPPVAKNKAKPSSAVKATAKPAAASKAASKKGQA